MARLRRICFAVAVLAALAGFSSHGAYAAAPPQPACPFGGPNQLASAHFLVDYNGDSTTADYITETQAGDILAAAERAYSTFVAMGYPTPLVSGSGKTEFSVLDLSPFKVSSLTCFGSVDFDTSTVGTANTAYSVGFDVFEEIALRVMPSVPGTNDWLIQAASSWASWRALGYPAASGGDLGPFEMALDCWDPNGAQACSEDGYVNLGGSRWPFYEYLNERFGQTFLLDVFGRAQAAATTTPPSPTPAMDALQAALNARGTSVGAEYAAFTTKMMAGGWTATSLNVATPPVSGSVFMAGAATGDTAPQNFGIDHLATRYIEIDRGDGDGSHACYAATLTIHVTIPANVTSQPTFYWNGTGSTPVPLTLSGNSATTTVPWDTCAWQNKGLLALPNTSLTENGTNFVVWTHIDVDTTIPATATPPPAPTSIYGQVVDTGSAVAVPDIVVVGPQLMRVSATATKLHIVVQSSSEGTMAVMLGTLSLGTVSLRPGANDLYFTLPKAQLARLRTSSATNILTLTPTSADGRNTGAAVTQKVAFTPAKKVVKHKKAKPAVKHKKKITHSK